ncbi:MULTISPECIES: MerR family transcriptional regulator [unclassified Brevibacterium]|uniref:MerR family transcriptional regulator n=1 Tax=unclassified Brevibacterium TaxID=2614124 RepID=UPI001092EADA|nr:MerR family transcriptional regulator [Brevibacterium sp. S22]TGD33248.1 MerR family transcriptional regulator [Brevibacterium sp. S22]
MAWSTRELADLAGTTVKTVRHYHGRGLLAAPERTANGYKQYRTEHLVRLLQIRRLSELGFSLNQIRDFDSAFDIDGTGSPKQVEAAEGIRSTLAALDEELAADIARRQQMRDDIAAIFEHGTAVDLPRGFGAVRGALTEADRGLLLVYSQVLDVESIASLRAMLAEVNSTEASREFQVLPADADDETRRELARRYAPQVRAIAEKCGWTDRLGEVPHRRRRHLEETIGAAMVQLYNRAQIDVLVRVEEINGASGEGRTPSESEESSEWALDPALRARFWLRVSKKSEFYGRTESCNSRSTPQTTFPTAGQSLSTITLRVARMWVRVTMRHPSTVPDLEPHRGSAGRR